MTSRRVPQRWYRPVGTYVRFTEDPGFGCLGGDVPEERRSPSIVRPALTYREASGVLDRVEVAASARKHGISDADILHAWRNVLRVAEQDHDGESRLIAVGPARRSFLDRLR